MDLGLIWFRIVVNNLWDPRAIWLFALPIADGAQPAVSATMLTS